MSFPTFRKLTPQQVAEAALKQAKEMRLREQLMVKEHESLVAYYEDRIKGLEKFLADSGA